MSMQTAKCGGLAFLATAGHPDDQTDLLQCWSIQTRDRADLVTLANAGHPGDRMELLWCRQL